MFSPGLVPLAPGQMQMQMPTMAMQMPGAVAFPGMPTGFAAPLPQGQVPPAIGGQLQAQMFAQFGQPNIGQPLFSQLMQPLPQPMAPPLGSMPIIPMPPPPGSMQTIPPPPGSMQMPAAMMTSPYQLLAGAQISPTQCFEQASQAYEQVLNATPEPEVTELAHHFKLDERITKDLDIQMKRRKDTVESDCKALWEILEGARNPAGLLRVKLREMEEGHFRGTLTPDRDIEDLAKKFGLDAQAAAKLAEVLSKRDDRKKDIRQIGKHLELSNKPSSLVMLMLKDLRAGKYVADPEFPAAVGSLAHKRGLKRGPGARRSRSRSRSRRRRRRSSSSSPPSEFLRRQARIASGLPPDEPARNEASGSGGSRPMTLLERFG